ncbi:hypothetical protein HanIR_Chr03g0115611 [Helianthus annuus]|nr:hypothetical protein HanIR_Chr03g0115611 [Helianthus annuus]
MGDDGVKAIFSFFCGGGFFREGLDLGSAEDTISVGLAFESGGNFLSESFSPPPLASSSSS